MAFAVKHIQDRIAEQWIVGIDSQKACDLVKAYESKLAENNISKHSAILICEEDPLNFTCELFASLKSGANIFLANPHWGSDEWAACSKQLNPDLVFGSNKLDAGKAPKFPEKLKGMIAIPTGGTGGILKFALHDWKTLASASKATHDFFNLKQSNCCCTLPLWHVSGLMQLVRSYISGGYILFSDWKRIEQEDYPHCNDFQISLVPTQLERILKSSKGVGWLKRFSIIYLGGAAAHPDLIKKARQHKLPIASVYGMTETAAMTAAQLPEEFVDGKSISASPLPHASIQIVNDNGDYVQDNNYGIVRIDSASLYKGYFHDYLQNSRTKIKYFDSDDEGMRDQNGRLYIRGRLDRIIISGGEKVNPSLTEEALKGSGLVKDIIVLGIDDKEWGQKLAAVYTSDSKAEEEQLIAYLKDKLSPWMIPKAWARVQSIPVDESGKTRRKELQSLFRL